MFSQGTGGDTQKRGSGEPVRCQGATIKMLRCAHLRYCSLTAKELVEVVTHDLMRQSHTRAVQCESVSTRGKPASLGLCVL